MKRVLIIAPDFPPSSYPPALRARLFATHLTEFGWQPIILTVAPEHYEWPADKEIEKLLPMSLCIVRTPALPIKVTRKIGIGDIGLRSLWHHWKAIKKLCQREKIDLILISVPPYFQAVLGRLAHEMLKIPYVIDYIDPWVSFNYGSLPRKERPWKRTLSYALSCVLEPFVLRKVSHMVAVSEKTTKGVASRYRWLNGIPQTEIPYGGEVKDFEYLREHPSGNKIFDPYDGMIHVSSVGRGGNDLLPAIQTVLEAIKLGLRDSPSIFSKIRLHFVGTSYSPNGNGAYSMKPMAERMGLGEYVDERPQRVTYLESLKIILDSHALVAIGSNRPHYFASKIFPYILAKRPFLAIFHEASSVSQVLKETGSGELVTFNEEEPLTKKVSEVKEALEKILQSPSDCLSRTRWQVFENYTARAMTERLARAFDEVLSRSSR